MGPRGELGRADVRHPDLDRAKPLGPESLAVIADSLGCGHGGATASHAETLHVTGLGANSPTVGVGARGRGAVEDDVGCVRHCEC